MPALIFSRYAPSCRRRISPRSHTQITIFAAAALRRADGAPMPVYRAVSSRADAERLAAEMFTPMLPRAAAAFLEH